MDLGLRVHQRKWIAVFLSTQTVEKQIANVTPVVADKYGSNIINSYEMLPTLLFWFRGLVTLKWDKSESQSELRAKLYATGRDPDKETATTYKVNRE